MLRTSVARTTTSLLPGDSWFSGEHVAPRTPVVTVTTRVVRLKGSATTPNSPAPFSFSPSSSPSPVKLAPAKRKRTTAIDDRRLRAHPKKPRAESVASSSSTQTRPKARSERSSSKLSVPPIEPIYRNSRSRSVTAFADVAPQITRDLWTDEDGAPGSSRLSSEHVVRKLMGSYQAFFRNPDDPEDNSWEPHETDYPFADLEYPNSNASERFILLSPKDKDHYNPIFCLQDSLHVIVKYYLTPEQRALFGTIPEELLSSPSSTQDAIYVENTPSRLASLTSSPLTPMTSQNSSPATPSTDLLRTLARSVHLRDGPMFVKTMGRINSLLRQIKAEVDPASGNPNPLRHRPKCWEERGLPKKVLRRIIEETYQRSIGPNIESLRRYTAFSSQVYGELTPTFIADIIKATGLRPDSLFLDLGSGVGNVALQASLESGCKSFGIEIMQTPARLADQQLEQFKIRCRMWGVKPGDIELCQGDMRDNDRLSQLVAKADVLLVNNYAFDQKLNESLNTKFLDLKEGAIVVSLKPFAPLASQRLTERNIDEISAIFHVTSRPYHTGFVSWSSGTGHYYLHRVDREGYNDCKERLEKSLSAVRTQRRRSSYRS